MSVIHNVSFTHQSLPATPLCPSCLIFVPSLFRLPLLSLDRKWLLERFFFFSSASSACQSDGFLIVLKGS